MSVPSIQFKHLRQSALSVVIAAFLGVACFSAYAQENTGNALKGVSQEVSDPEALETIEADKLRTILKLFLKNNPDAKEHKLGIVSEAFVEDSSNPALRLERMWVSSKGTLLEITGLPRKGLPNSASISPETLRLTNLKSRVVSRLESYDGAAQLRDQRGGTALVVKPGDTLYLLMDLIDDFEAHSLDYTGWDGRPSKYFDRIDPRFRERYDKAYGIASALDATPEQMKDFLIEFNQIDPDKRALKIFLALITKMRSQNTFEGYYNTYLLIKDPADAKAAIRLARTDEHKEKLENIAVATLKDKSRLIDIKLKITPSNTTTSEGSCWFSCNYNFTAQRAISGMLTVTAKQAGSPIKLRYGRYKVNFSTETNVRQWGKQESNWLGGFDKEFSEGKKGSVSVTLGPPNYTATVPIDFGPLQVAFFQRGSAGGYTGYWAIGDGKATVRFKDMELIK